jgi:2-amino-4-hydroxy-6-hydroxymethyldihydropteridine diphosphokinase
MPTVYLALGSNVGDSGAYIDRTVELLGSGSAGGDGTLKHVRRAPLYRSKAAGYTDQPDFLNTAVSGETGLTPEDLLAFIKKTEQRLGRQRRFRWGPREIDIDIIFYGDLVQKSKALTLPHPLFRERDFVLRPLADLDPDLKDPVTGQTVAELLADIPADGETIVQEIVD